MGTKTNAGREHHEKEAWQQVALKHLRAGERLYSKSWFRKYDGHRLAATIHILRGRYGFDIIGEGVRGNPYLLLDPNQLPQFAAVTPKIKEAYYASPHWRAMREVRLEIDGYRCVACGSNQDLVVHHTCYDLFNERPEFLQTLCDFHHSAIHQCGTIAFPLRISVEHCIRLGIDPQFPEWLLPRNGVNINENQPAVQVPDSASVERGIFSTGAESPN